MAAPLRVRRLVGRQFDAKMSALLRK